MRVLAVLMLVFAAVAFLSCAAPGGGGYCPPARCIVTETVPSTAAPEQVQP